MKKAKIFFVWLGIAVILALASLVVFRRSANAPAKNLPDSQNQPKTSQPACGIESCHGLNVVCGPNIPQNCPPQYQPGDACRQYARCQVQNGKCQMLGQAEFNQCKNCVQSCEKDFEKSSLKLSECESQCHLKINQTQKAVPD